MVEYGKRNPHETTLKEVDRVAKKQKTCSSKTADALAKLIKAVDKARSQVQQGDASQVQAVLAELLNEVSRLGTSAQLASETKDLHGAVSKLGKVVDRHYSTDVCKAARETELDRLALNQVIAEHLYHEGQFDIGDCFVGEAGLPDGSLMKQPYSSMHTVLQQIHQRNLRPALDWVVQHRQQLGVCTAFEFSLHQLAFLQTLQDQGEWQGSARRGGDVVMPCGHVIAEHNDFRRIGSIGPCSVPALLSMGVGGGSKAEGRSSLG